LRKHPSCSTTPRWWSGCGRRTCATACDVSRANGDPGRSSMLPLAC
jgi:hypothetical protein